MPRVGQVGIDQATGRTVMWDGEQAVYLEPTALPELPGLKAPSRRDIPDPVSRYGSSPEYSAAGFGGNVLKGIVRAPVQLAESTLDVARTAAGDTTPAINAGMAAYQTGKGIADTYQREGAAGVARDAAIGASDFVYQNPVETAIMARGSIPGLRRIPTPGQGMAAAGERALSRDPAKLLRKAEERMTPVLKPSEAAVRNNPTKNFGQLAAREGAELGLTRGSRGLVTPEGVAALSEKRKLVGDVAQGMQQASQSQATIGPALQAMRGTVGEVQRSALNAADAAPASRYVAGVARNPAYNDPILNAQGQVTGYQRKVVPIQKLVRGRELLKDANNVGPAFTRESAAGATTRRTRLAGQHALKEQEHRLLNAEFGTPDAPTPYTQVQELRSDLIPLERVVGQAARRESKKSPVSGWRSAIGMGTPGVMGSGLGWLTGGPVGGVVGAGTGAYAGHKFMNWIDSPGRQSAIAARQYQRAIGAPAYNATLAQEAQFLAPAMDAMLVERALREQAQAEVDPRQITEEAMRRALLAQMGGDSDR